jgi:hypothetical protein
MKPHTYKMLSYAWICKILPQSFNNKKCDTDVMSCIFVLEIYLFLNLCFLAGDACQGMFTKDERACVRVCVCVLDTLSCY